MFNENYPNDFDTNQQGTDQQAAGLGQGNQSNTQDGGWQNESRDRAQNESRGSWQSDDRGGWQNESWNRQGQSDQTNSGQQTSQNYYERYRSSQAGSQGSSYRGQGNYSGQNNYGNYNSSNSWSDGGQRSPKKSGKGPKIAIVAVLAAVFVAFCVGVSWFAVDSIKSSLSASSEAVTKEEEVPSAEVVEEETEAAEEAQQSDQIASAGQIQESGQVTAVVTDVTDVVEKVMPACVSITNMSTQEIQSFWGQTYSQDSESNGSGIIIGQNDTELLIVSNNHVVEDADTLYVQFIDGQSVQALVKGTDSTVDLAVLAVSLADISKETMAEICIAQMGDSDSLKIGEPAIAIGNALGYGQSVTTGVISALNRTLEVSETGSSNALIQTDAAINPGNSGGALLNINGEVVGINSSKIGDSLVEGMGYAIPISTAKPIIEELMSKETKVKVAEDERGYLGISCINVTSDIAANYNMPEGVFVAQVYEGTGADKAGLVRGDIITAFDGTQVSNQTELTALTQYYKAGETVEITIMQGSANGYQAKNVQITLSSIDEMNAAAEAQQQQQQNTPGYRMP